MHRMPYTDCTSLEQIIARFVQDCEAGVAVDTRQILAAHPALAAELSEFFETNEQFTAAAQAVRNELSTQKSNLATTLGTGGQHPSSLALNPPKVFGDYAILEEIDRGGMGVVYKAVHVHLGRTVALKLIRSGELASEEEIARFRSEAEAAAALSHPGIVPIYEVGRLHGLVYYTMAFIEGRSLAEVTSDGPMDPHDAMKVVHKLCTAVEYAHRCGVFHRDLKPANVLLDTDGQPIIIDFGLAKFEHRDSSLTVTGQILGTPAYMAPEQATAKAPLGPTADVYSLGAILYCLCAGQPPFLGPTPFDVLLQVLDREPPAPSRINRRVSRELDYVCRKALEKEPGQRYASAKNLAADLQNILQGEPIDCQRERLLERLESWWRREPILVAHVSGIGTTLLIVATASLMRGESWAPFPYRIGLLLVWLVISFPLQRWAVRAAWRDTAFMSWASVDVVLYTILIAIADPPRSMLLVGYPMMIVASSLLYRKRFVTWMTGLCLAGFLSLAVLTPFEDFAKPDFCAIFVCGLIVIWLSLLATIRRVRGMSHFYEDAN